MAAWRPRDPGGALTTPMQDLVTWSRRHLLGAGAAWTLGPLAGCAGLAGRRVDPPSDDADGQALVELADGVWMAPGLPGEIGPANRGRVANLGVVVGPDGVLVVDAGVSRRQGEALWRAIRRVTDRPVRQLLVTHVRQEFLFGAGAFRDRGVPLRMQHDAAQLMAARCENCLKTLRRELGDDEMAGTVVPRADERFSGEHVIDAIGRPVRVLHHGHSSGPGDVAVLDERSGVLFAGGLLDAQRIPDVQDARFDGWRAALADLHGQTRQGRVRRLVPGHGPAGGPAQVAAVQRYLDGLEASMGELVRQGTGLADVAELAVLPEFADWGEYDTIHRRNASIVFLRLEREHLFKDDRRAQP